jgi:hypothetical protein
MFIWRSGIESSKDDKKLDVILSGWFDKRDELNKSQELGGRS